MPVQGFLFALAASLVLTPVVRTLATRFGFVAAPRHDRWHQRPTALLGGAAIFASFLFGAVVTNSLIGLWPLAAAASYLFVVGLIDDVKHIKPATKLVLQLIGGAALSAFGYRLEFFESVTLNLLFTILWFVGITNAFNLLDNMDGLAAGVALLSGFALMALAVNNDTAAAGLLAVFCGALAGFLVFNFNPASIFMGDSGSLFIGSLLAGISLVPAAYPRSQLLSILAGPALILLVPILDTTFVAVCRTLAGRRISIGGRDHTSHRLVAIGLSERRAVLLLYAVAAGGGLLAVSMPYAGPGTISFALTLYLLGVGLVLVYLGAVAVYDGSVVAAIRDRPYTPLLLELTYRRRVFEVLLDFVLAGVSYYTAYRLRFEGREFAEYFPVFLSSLPIILAARMLALLLTGAYRGVWRYFGVADLGNFVRAVALGSTGAVVATVYLFRFRDFSRGVFIIDAMLFGVLLIGSRLSFRILADYVTRRKRTGRRVVVYGAGDGGALVVRELRNNQRMGLMPIGFIDDDRLKRAKVIHGLPVFGGRERLGELLSAGDVDEVVISTVKLPPDELRAIADMCDEFQVPVYLARLTFDAVGSITAAH